MPDIVKIGMTTRSVNERVRELNSSTSSVGDFKCAYSVKVSRELEKIEKAIHNSLIKYRKNSRREFFGISVDHAIKIIDKEAKNYILDAKEQEKIDAKRKENARIRIEAIEAPIRAARAEAFVTFKKYRFSTHDEVEKFFPKCEHEKHFKQKLLYELHVSNSACDATKCQEDFPILLSGIYTGHRRDEMLLLPKTKSDLIKRQKEYDEAAVMHRIKYKEEQEARKKKWENSDFLGKLKLSFFD